MILRVGTERKGAHQLGGCLWGQDALGYQLMTGCKHRQQRVQQADDAQQLLGGATLQLGVCACSCIGHLQGRRSFGRGRMMEISVYLGF